MQIENVQIIDTAELPELPVSPRKRVNYAVGVLLGLMAGFGLVFLIEFLDDTVKTPEDVLKHTGFVVIGTIPVFSRKRKEGLNMLDANVVVTHCDPKSPVSEAYRVLRTNIQYSGVDKPMKTIVVTSSGPVEGKTTTIVNLAVTFAQAGCRVLLIDSDMRKPKLHKVFVIPNTKGLTNLLIEHGDYRDYVQDCDVPNLEILTCGTIPHNPSELLSSGR